MTRWNEAVYVYEKTLPNGQKRLIEMTETQIVRHMRGRLKYPRYKEQTHLISDFMAISQQRLPPEVNRCLYVRYIANINIVRRFSSTPH